MSTHREKINETVTAADDVVFVKIGHRQIVMLGLEDVINTLAYTAEYAEVMKDNLARLMWNYLELMEENDYQVDEMLKFSKLREMYYFLEEMESVTILEKEVYEQRRKGC